MRPESLNNLTEEAFDAWEPIEPPADFAASVVAAASRDEAAPPLPQSSAQASVDRRPWWSTRGLLLGAAAAAIAAAATAALLGGEPRGPKIDPAASIAVPPLDTPNVTLDADKDDPHAGYVPTPMPAGLSATIDEYVSSHGRLYGETFQFHGTILVARDGDVVFRRSYGDAVRGEGGASIAHRPDTRIRLGTLTQQITATAIMLLVDRGTIQLDEQLHTYLPDYPEHARGITIRQLLSHSSGIPSFTDMPSQGSWRGEPHTTASLLARFSEDPLEFPPGTDFDPSNSGYAVLGAIIEAATGQSYGEFVHSEIFVPHNMIRSTVGDPPPQALVAPGYLFGEDEQLQRVHPANLDLSSFGAAGNIVTTADDLGRWANALFEGRLLQEKTLQEMLAPATEDGYALGWISEREFGQDVSGHPGGLEGMNAAIRYYRDDHTLLLALANNDVIDCRSVVDELGKIVHGRPATPPIEREESKLDPSTFARYAGDYVLTEESRANLGRFFASGEVERIAQAHVYAWSDRLSFSVPGHGIKWMHGSGGDSFFFKDAAATVALFVFPSDRDPADRTTPPSALLLRQGPLEIRLERRADGGPVDAVLPSL